MNKLTRLQSSLMVGSLTFLLSSSVMALTIVNGTSSSTALKVELGIPNAYALEHKNEVGVCWGNEKHISETSLIQKQFFSTGISGDRALQYLCVHVDQGTQLSINPVKDIPECTIEFVKLATKDRGLARATEACGYIGRCPDSNNPDGYYDYTPGNQNCCPTGHWNNGTCQAYPLPR
ncbi:MAG: hypothetical protein ACHP9Y_05245 [Gammaproteobacteria bacterium]